MALQTVTLVLDETWRLISNSVGRFRLSTDSNDGALVVLGDTAPAAAYGGGQRDRSLDFVSLETKVWAKAAAKRAQITVTRVVDVLNHQEVVLGDVGLSVATFASSLVAGAEIGTVTGRVAGDSIRLMPKTGGVVELNSDRAKLLRGLGEAPSKMAAVDFEIEIEQSHPLAANSPKRTKIPLTVTLGAVGGALVPKNNLALVAGDSRPATFSADSPTPYRLNVNGFVTHALQRGKYKIRIAPGGNFAVGGYTTANVVARLPEMEALNVGIWIVEVSTNDLSDLDATKSGLRTICTRAQVNGAIVVLANDLPRDDQQAAAAARRDFIETTLKAEYPNNLAVVDTFRSVLADGTVGAWKPGLTVETAGAGLHPNAKGNFLIAQPFGVALEALGATFETFARPSLPTMSVRSGANPNGPVLNNFALGGSVAVNSGGVVGNNPTETSIQNASAGTSTSDCVVTPSVYVNSDGFNEWAIRVAGNTGTGTPSIIANIEGAFNVPSVLDRVLAGELFWSAARLKVDPNPVGFRGLGLSCRATGKIGTDPQYTDQWGQCYQNALVPIDGPILYDAVMASNVGVVRAGWAGATLRNLFTQVALSLAPSSAVDITFRISQPGLFAKAA